MMGLLPWRNFKAQQHTFILTITTHCVFPVYVLDAIFQGNISGLPKCEPCSCSGIYLGHSLFYEVSVALVLNLETGDVSTQFHVVFYDELSTVTFIREATIPPSWTYILQCISQRG